jgi:hypothetical protein
MISVISGALAETIHWHGKAFSALQVAYDDVMPDKKVKSKVYISKQGFRMEGIENPDSPTPNMIMLYNIASETSLLIDPVQKSYVVLQKESADSVTEHKGTILSDVPCKSYKTLKKGKDTTWQSRAVEVWRCQADENAKPVTQYFDKKLHVVIREDNNGHIIELHDIKPGKQRPDMLKPPKGYQKMSISEIMTGYVQLDKYEK